MLAHTERFILIVSPIGVIRVEGTPELVTRLWLPSETPSGNDDLPQLKSGEVFPALEEAKDWLTRYFAGEKVSWAGHSLPGFSAFTSVIYNSLLNVPFGETVSYGELAEMAGSPKASRAVGRAMATNPLPIFIPCHRVLGSDGSLHGYGGGLPMKKALLEHEGVKV